MDAGGSTVLPITFVYVVPCYRGLSPGTRRFATQRFCNPTITTTLSILDETYALGSFRGKFHGSAEINYVQTSKLNFILLERVTQLVHLRAFNCSYFSYHFQFNVEFNP